MSDTTIEGLMDLLEVRVDAFGVCRLSKTAALKCAPIDKVVIHFVLSGEGALHVERASYELRAGSIIIVPANLPKIISGVGPVEELSNASEQCVLEEGLARFEIGTGQASLVLGCAAVEATIGGVVEVFEHLWEPMLEDAAGSSVVPIMAIIERELRGSLLGTRAIVSDLMKHVLIAVFREQLRREGYRSWLWPAMMNREIGRAAVAMMSRPQDSHTIKSLATIAGMSRSRFASTFSEVFGRSPMEFLQSVRLRTAQGLLMNSSMPIKSVAAAVGFASRSHFSRAFQTRYGDAPSTFRCQYLSDRVALR